jgi:hypothetical protein
VDLNVCPACGAWSDDYVVADEAVLACQACGHRRPFLRLPLFALVCDDAELEARLRARPPWRAWTDDKVTRMLAFNQWVKRNAATTTPPMELLDTSGHSVQDSAACVRAWVQRHLDPYTC